MVKKAAEIFNVSRRFQNTVTVQVGWMSDDRLFQMFVAEMQKASWPFQFERYQTMVLMVFWVLCVRILPFFNLSRRAHLRVLKLEHFTAERTICIVYAEVT